jgi:hypothetical protein
MVVHAKLPPDWPKPTLCGRFIGRRSTGSYEDDAVTCKPCLRALEVVNSPWERVSDERR